MGMLIYFYSIVVISVILLVVSSVEITVPLWPLPSSYSLGNSTVYLSNTFEFISSQDTISKTLKMNMLKYQDLIRGKDVKDDADKGIRLDNCIVDLSQSAENLSINSDESYELSLTTSHCQISAESVYGAIHAMETLTQLLTKNRDNSFTVCKYVPVEIVDTPRFKHRGLLIDTARHYLPISVIKQVIDTLPASKLNVLHWHVTDAQSFPLYLSSYPSIINSAFTPKLIYLPNELSEVYSYAKLLGVRVIFEFDIPGHTGCLWRSLPNLMSKCYEKYSYNVNDFALDPTSESTYDFVFSVLKALRQVENDDDNQVYIHVGGDEVVYGCWKEDDSITSYMTSNNITTYDALLASFVERVDNYIISMNALPIHWEEVFYTGAKVPDGTVFQVWDSKSTSSDLTILQTIVASNYSVIASASDYWYLNYLSITWQMMYAYNPTDGLSDDQIQLVLGGEAAIWGEYVDETNLLSTIYPRLFAVSERLWSLSSVDSTDEALSRLVIQRCRLLQRGYMISPVQPGYCDVNYV